jgi:hypothetical protein
MSLNNGVMKDIQCNSVDDTQQWQLVFTGNNDHEVKVISIKEPSKYLNITVNNLNPNKSLIFSTTTQSNSENILFTLSDN